jgi:hypothetical protein
MLENIAISEPNFMTIAGPWDVKTKPDFSAGLCVHLFPVPFMGHVWPDVPQLNRELRSRILEHATRAAGAPRSNAGGWRSELGRLEFCGDAGQRLADEATSRTSPKPLRHQTWGAGRSAGRCTPVRTSTNPAISIGPHTPRRLLPVGDRPLRHRCARRRGGDASALVESLPGPRQHLPAAGRLREAAARHDSVFSKLHPANGVSPQWRARTRFDRLQSAQGTIPMTSAAALRLWRRGHFRTKIGGDGLA